MGWLSRFLRKQKSGESYVCHRADILWQSAKNSQKIDETSIAAAMLYTIAIYSENNNKNIWRETDSPILWIDKPESYFTDSALFEIGCYVFFRVSALLAKKRENSYQARELSDKVRNSFADIFIKLFTESLGIQNVPLLLRERLTKYVALSEENCDTQEYHSYLTQLIFQTKNNTPPQSYLNKEVPLTFDLPSTMLVKIALTSWEAISMLTLMRLIDSYFDKLGQ